MIHEEKIEWIIPDYTESEAHSSLQEVQEWGGGNTGSNLNKKDYAGKKVNSMVYNDLKKVMQKTKVSNTISRTKYKATLEIQRICKLLDLPQQVIEECIKEYSWFNERNKLRNRNVYSCVCCIVSIVCARNEFPISVGEILKCSVITKRKFNSDYFYIAHLYESAPITTARKSQYLQKYLNNVERSWTNYQSFKKKLTEISTKIGLFQIFGREGIVYSGTLVYYLLRYYKYQKKDLLLKIIITNRLTLKNCWTNFLSTHPQYCYMDAPTKEVLA